MCVCGGGGGRRGVYVKRCLLVHMKSVVVVFACYSSFSSDSHKD